MKELIERLEKATGPDRNLDIEIGKIVDPALEWHREVVRWQAQHYTACLAAALTLVPEGYRWIVGNAWKDKHGSCPAMASVCPAGEYGYGPASAATPAIALCIAALKARMSALPSTES